MIQKVRYDKSHKQQQEQQEQQQEEQQQKLQSEKRYNYIFHHSFQHVILTTLVLILSWSSTSVESRPPSSSSSSSSSMNNMNYSQRTTTSSILLMHKKTKQQPKHFAALHLPRGGGGRSIMTTSTSSSSSFSNDSEHETEDSEEQEFTEEEQQQQQQQQQEEELLQQQQIMKKYRMEQQHLLQLRSTFLAEALSSRGVQLGPTMVDVCTPDGTKAPESVDWDCCLSTVHDPKSCLYSFDAEPNTKVVAPAGTTQYISLSALNRLRRSDPTKVEPMWHSRYAILSSWFDDESEYSLLQYVGWKGFVVSKVLLDAGGGRMLKGLLIVGLWSVFLVLGMPLVECLVGRFLVSSVFWMKWQNWARIVHAALPLKLLIGQLIWKCFAGLTNDLESKVREYVVDLECAILEESIPITSGNEVDNDMNDNDDEDDDDDESDDW
eukprot:CAMPEP_0184860738 /NCGR_PEP_ID=MMETSP0580-20130426/5568_1 /TAXON_ID=1118495 /ORGANISM="Dactyliosolen fragilissimus" /LENGTH=435 /DNA_ID=CAMNT_0027357951 /DNA_START=62 /DNA_END=1369 /DNA_ORIENTATION=+